MSKYQNDRQFEDDVRRTADAVFEIPAGGCKSRLFKKGKSHIEIDGVAESRYVTHLLMATTSTKFQKVKEDVEKLVFAASKERQRGVAVKSWMIVEKTPEAPHTTHAREHDVELLSMRQFRERFFDGRDYVMKREHAVFGSARDLDTESITVAADEFIEPPMTNLETRLPIAFDDLLQKVAQGFTLVLLAPFGSGKSLTVRQLWFALRDKYLSAEIDCVPVAINLREHWGAQYADEIFLRHGRSLSLHREGDLTVAWRTGSLALLIDGFDEVASQGVVQIEKSEVLREIRRTALAGVKEMVLKSPDATGIVLAGRDHYFDNDAEMLHALGLRSHKLVRVRIEEFDEDRAAQYLKRKGFSSPLPDWLPRRPLLLGYLARRQLLQDVLSIDFSQGRARAWVDLVNLICKREAEHERGCDGRGHRASGPRDTVA
ncbi:MAG: hypothetical protein M5U25_20995 [Planctomycetota bacterium]|nr:hypothetical protein [Planctomycetota bacterium]